MLDFFGSWISNSDRLMCVCHMTFIHAFVLYVCINLFHFVIYSGYKVLLEICVQLLLLCCLLCLLDYSLIMHFCFVSKLRPHIHLSAVI